MLAFVASQTSFLNNYSSAIAWTYNERRLTKSILNLDKSILKSNSFLTISIDALSIQFSSRKSAIVRREKRKKKKKKKKKKEKEKVFAFQGNIRLGFKRGNSIRAGPRDRPIILRRCFCADFRRVAIYQSRPRQAGTGNRQS